MEKINLVSMLGFILMANKDANPILMALYTSSCTMILNLVATLEDLYSFFTFLLQSFSYFLIAAWKKCCWGNNKKDGSAAVETSPLKPCFINNGDVRSSTAGTSLLIKQGDIEIVMERLGIYWDSSEEEDGDDELQLQERLSSSSSDEMMLNLFAENEPSIEELKEAFDIFDGNKDGYIDAKDLKRILHALGFVYISELECQRMIMGFNSNGELRIDFRKFMKIIEDSFSQ